MVKISILFLYLYIVLIQLDLVLTNIFLILFTLFLAFILIHVNVTKSKILKYYLQIRIILQQKLQIEISHKEKREEILHKLSFGKEMFNK